MLAFLPRVLSIACPDCGKLHIQLTDTNTRAAQCNSCAFRGTLSSDGTRLLRPGEPEGTPLAEIVARHRLPPLYDPRLELQRAEDQLRSLEAEVGRCRRDLAYAEGQRAQLAERVARLRGVVAAGA